MHVPYQVPCLPVYQPGKMDVNFVKWRNNWKFSNKIGQIHVVESGFGLVWFDFCFIALQHILGHFGRGQLP